MRKAFSIGIVALGLFGHCIVRADTASGALVRVKDIGRVELSSNTYALRSLLNNKEAAAIAVFQAPGSNALALSNDVRRVMERLAPGFPQGVQYSIVYDPTRFVQTSIEKVVSTLIEATLLVVLVVIIFLQTWRASIIPLIAVPVSVVGTFAALYLLGFSINTLTLFGLVLAIGIVVDDAIVVVENVERNIANGLSPREASYRTMEEVGTALIAIALVLTAVFVPSAFIVMRSCVRPLSGCCVATWVDFSSATPACRSCFTTIVRPVFYQQKIRSFSFTCATWTGRSWP